MWLCYCDQGRHWASLADQGWLVGRRGEEAALATENAVAALGRVLDRHGDAVDGAMVASAWLSALPLVEDRVEARATHAQLVRLVEASDARCALPAPVKLG